MNTMYSHINFLWTQLLVEELIRNGINQFFISPGSRSTPLTLAAAYNTKAQCTVHFDERGAGFAALGYGQATGKPAVLICTSGTAAANYFPAVIEASMSRIPMLIFTADRPPELRDTGANQTIDQVKLYGSYVRWFQDVACPSLDIQSEYLLTTIDQAIYQAQDNIPGPVHLNCMFREPLAPDNNEIDFSDYLFGISNWSQSNEPYTKYQNPILLPEISKIKSLSDKIMEITRGIIVCGKVESDAARESILKFAEVISYPVFADITSGLKSDKSPNVINHELLLDDDKIADEIKSNMILHFGGGMISKKLNRWLTEIRPENYIHIDRHPFRNDPLHIVTERFHCSIESFINSLLPLLQKFEPDKLWLNGIVERYNNNEEKMSGNIEKDSILSESLVSRLVSLDINKNSALFLGNSLSIRMMDKYLDKMGPKVPIGFNRGASGIDGCVATAVGWSMGLKKSVTLLIGDLSLFHDLNSLAMLKKSDYPISIVVLNNNGSGIFKYLSIAKQEDVFEKFWLTPHGMTFEKISEQFGLNYYKPSTPDGFISDYNKAQTSGRQSLIEVIIKSE